MSSLPVAGQGADTARGNVKELQSIIDASKAIDQRGIQAALATVVNVTGSIIFDATFYPGGHGPLWDLAEDASSIALIEAMFAAGKPIAAVCYAPAASSYAIVWDWRFA